MSFIIWTLASVVVVENLPEAVAVPVDPALLIGIGAIITAVTGLLGAITAFVVTIRREVKNVHRIVNARTDESLARIDQLVQSLQAAGVNIPSTPPSTASQGVNPP